MMEGELAQLRRRRAEELARQSGGGASGKPTELSADTMKTFLDKNPLAMVDVWAAWCGPCRTMEPIVEELAHELAGRVGVGKVDADRNYDVVQSFGVQGIPTFLFFRNGALAGRLVGARPKRDFVEVIRQLEAASPQETTPSDPAVG